MSPTTANSSREVSMSQSEIVGKYKSLYERAGAVGLVLLSDYVDHFYFNNIPGSDGRIAFNKLDDLERFLRGYELGYQSGNGELDND